MLVLVQQIHFSSWFLTVFSLTLSEVKCSQLGESEIIVFVFGHAELCLVFVPLQKTHQITQMLT